MAGLAVEFDLDQLTREIGALVPVAMPKTIADVSTYLSSAVRRRFDTTTGPDGERWADLKTPRSRRRDLRAKGGTGQKPLTDTGILKASASGQPGTAGAVVEKGPMSLVQGTRIAYGAIHNFGGIVRIPEQVRRPDQKPFSWIDRETGKRRFARRIRAHDVKIPARPFIGLNDKDVDRIVQIAIDNLSQGTP